MRAQVYNLTTYPNLVGLLEELRVDTEPSDMSFAVSMDAGRFEWGSRGLGALFAQRANLGSPAFWRMAWDVLRFNRQAPQVRSPCPQLLGQLQRSSCIDFAEAN
jgi:predicted NAD/FAD-binding protein